MNEELKLLRLLKAMCEPLGDGVQPHVVVHGRECFRLSLAVLGADFHQHVPVDALRLLALEERMGLLAVAQMRGSLQEAVTRAAS